MPVHTVNVVCPKCGSEQEGGVQCRNCFALLAGQRSAARRGPQERAGYTWKRRKSGGVFRVMYRIFTWSSLLFLVLAVILIFRKSTPLQVPIDPQAAARVEVKLRESQLATEAGQAHRLRLDTPELNTFLGANLALNRDPAPARGTPSPLSAGAEPSIAEVQSSVKDVKINLLEDRVQAYVLFDFHGQDLSLLLEGRLGVEDGYLRFEPTSGKLGSLPIPQATLESAVRRLLTSPENREKLHVSPEIGDIHIENGNLLITYR